MATCFRVYSDGSKKKFSPQSLADQNDWIEFNKIHRFGCALVVGDRYIDGTGYPAARQHAEHFVEEMKGSGWLT